ncbi:hypothetical protein Hanom_Chr17g01544481 [Helianthus anomalus]
MLHELAILRNRKSKERACAWRNKIWWRLMTTVSIDCHQSSSMSRFKIRRLLRCLTSGRILRPDAKPKIEVVSLMLCCYCRCDGQNSASRSPHGLHYHRCSCFQPAR